jgi:single-stranded DNA-binding protein
MKTITFDGRIGANGAEVRTTKGGKPYVRFSVANNSFANGAEKTEWFDVTSYDEYIINNRVKYLTKGTYIIVTGNPNVEVNVRDGKIWLNQYVTATTIDTPSFKKKDEDGATATANTVGASTSENVSVFTGGTASTVLTPKPEVDDNVSYPSQITATPSPDIRVYGSTQDGAISAIEPNDPDDLPF